MGFSKILTLFILLSALSCKTAQKGHVSIKCAPEVPSSKINYQIGKEIVTLDVYDINTQKINYPFSYFSSPDYLGTGIHKNIQKLLDFDLSKKLNVAGIVIFSNEQVVSNNKLILESSVGLLIYYVEEKIIKCRLFENNNVKWTEIMAVSKRNADYSTTEFYATGRYFIQKNRKVNKIIHLPISKQESITENPTFEYTISRLK